MKRRHSAEVIFDSADVSWRYVCPCGDRGPGRSGQHDALLDAIAQLRLPL